MQDSSPQPSCLPERIYKASCNWIKFCVILAQMNRNVTIVVIILTIVVIAGYLVWLRGRYIQELAPKLDSNQTMESVAVSSPDPAPSLTPTPTATASARPSDGKLKTASPSAKASPRR